MTAYERNTGKKATTLSSGIGDAVLWRRQEVGRALGELTSLWEDGIFLEVMGKRFGLVVPSQATQRTMGPEEDRLDTPPTMAYLRR